MNISTVLNRSAIGCGAGFAMLELPMHWGSRPWGCSAPAMRVAEEWMEMEVQMGGIRAESPAIAPESLQFTAEIP
jgi:hypothetical protein